MDVSDIAVMTAFNGSGGGGGGTGTIDIRENGTYNVADYAEANVDVAVGVFPTGQKSITANGTYDVYNFATAKVAIPAPTGTLVINENGIKAVMDYAYVQVNVPSSGITPTGTKSITANGTYDVTEFASASVNVATTLTTYTVKVLNNSSVQIEVRYPSSWVAATNKLSHSTKTLNANSTGTYTVVAGGWIVIRPMATKDLSITVPYGVTKVMEIGTTYGKGHLLVANDNPATADLIKVTNA